jgi:hypothetical protein
VIGADIRRGPTPPEQQEHWAGAALLASWALELSGTLSILLSVVGVTRDTTFSSPDYT